jgi:hypothetical protein
MKPTIEIIVSPTGEILIDAVGFKGADCEQATRYLEQALGVGGTKNRKPEYPQRKAAKHQQRLGA